MAIFYKQLDDALLIFSLSWGVKTNLPNRLNPYQCHGTHFLEGILPEMYLEVEFFKCGNQLFFILPSSFLFKNIIVTGYTEAWNISRQELLVITKHNHVTFNKFYLLPQLTKFSSLNSLYFKKTHR